MRSLGTGGRYTDVVIVKNKVTKRESFVHFSNTTAYVLTNTRKQLLKHQYKGLVSWPDIQDEPKSKPVYHTVADFV